MYIMTDRRGFTTLEHFASIKDAAAWLIENNPHLHYWEYKFMPFRDLLKPWGLSHEDQIPDFLADEDESDCDKQVVRDLMDWHLEEVADGDWGAEILYIGADNMEIVRPKNFEYQVEHEFFERGYKLKEIHDSEEDA